MDNELDAYMHETPGVSSIGDCIISRETSSETSTLKDDLMADQETPLTGDTGQLSHPNWGWMNFLCDQ